MSTANSTLETVRCRHRPGCKTHDDSCDCREFTSPSLSHTRSGAVLHLEWVEENGARFNLDVDLVPILPTSTPYNGDITSVANTLATERVVGWLDELGKIGVANDPENAKTLSNWAACYQKLERLDLCVEVRI